MRKIALFLLSAAAIVMVAAMPVFAQPGAANEAAASSVAGLKTIGACVGFAIAVVGGAIGQSKIGAAAHSSTAASARAR